MLKFWLPMGTYDQELLFHPEAFELTMRSAVHEVGHAEVAAHFGAQVLGIAFAVEMEGLSPEELPPLRPMAIYRTADTMNPNEMAAIYAGGAAGEILEYGSYLPGTVSQDIVDVSKLSGGVQFEDSLHIANDVLLSRKVRFHRMAQLLRKRLFESDDHLTMETLPNWRTGAFVVTEVDLLDPDRVATHEAGHAVVGLSLGAKLVDIMVYAPDKLPESLKAASFRAGVAVNFANIRKIESRHQYLVAVGGMAAEKLIFDEYDEVAALDDIQLLEQVGISRPQISGLIPIAMSALQKNLDFFNQLRASLQRGLREQHNPLAVGASLNARFNKKGNKVDVSAALDAVLPL